MRIFDANMDVGETSPREWLKDAYQRIDAALEPLMNLGITDDEKKELEDYLTDDDELGKAIWLIAKDTTLPSVEREITDEEIKEGKIDFS